MSYSMYTRVVVYQQGDNTELIWPYSCTSDDACHENILNSECKLYIPIGLSIIIHNLWMDVCLVNGSK